MFELGNESKNEHQQISSLCEDLKFDKVYLVGENFLQTKTKNKTFDSFEQLKKHIENSNLKDNTVLIKGSRGMALERLLDLF